MATRWGWLVYATTFLVIAAVLMFVPEAGENDLIRGAKIVGFWAGIACSLAAICIYVWWKDPRKKKDR